jgi:hypothetical protein
MKRALLILLVLHAIGFAAAPMRELTNFELTDQDAKTRTYNFPKAKVTVMTVANRDGSAQLAPWVQLLYDRYGKQIDIDGIADVSMIAKPFRGIFRAAFRKQLAYSVMLDWDGLVVKQFGYEKNVANVYVIDRDGRIVTQIGGEPCGVDLALVIDEVLQMIGVPVLLRQRQYDHGLADEDAALGRSGRHVLVHQQIRIVQRLDLLPPRARLISKLKQRVGLS